MLEALSNLYEDIGKKIKNWAIVIFAAEAILCILAGLIFFLANENASIAWMGFVILFFGPIGAWVSSWILYGFGELIDKTCENEKNTRKTVELLSRMNANAAQRLEHQPNKSQTTVEHKVETVCTPVRSVQKTSVTEVAEKGTSTDLLQKAEQLLARGSLGDCEDAIKLLDRLQGDPAADALKEKCLDRVRKVQKEQGEESRIKRMYNWRAEGRCQHCGGELKGLLTKTCVTCGIEKDY